MLRSAVRKMGDQLDTSGGIGNILLRDGQNDTYGCTKRITLMTLHWQILQGAKYWTCARQAGDKGAESETNAHGLHIYGEHDGSLLKLGFRAAVADGSGFDQASSLD